MNPSAKAAGLSFQLSSPTGRDGSMFEQRSDVRSHDGGTASRTIAKVRRSARTQTAKYFTRWRFHQNLAVFGSRYVAVGSPAESAFTYADYTRRRRFSYGLSTVRLRFLLSAKAGGFLEQKR